MKTIDLREESVRALNQALHDQAGNPTEREWEVLNSDGAHNLACGLDAEIAVHIRGHAGYYCAGMNQKAEVTVHGNAGVGVGENMMSGVVRVKGNASQCAGATAHGGLLVIEGDASSRCGISMKGVNIVVKGSVGHMSGFMAQAGCLVICGDADDALGDSIYETHIYVKGRIGQLGADCVEKPMKPHHREELAALLQQAGVDEDPDAFRRYGSGRTLYNFHVDNAAAAYQGEPS